MAAIERYTMSFGKSLPGLPSRGSQSTFRAGAGSVGGDRPGRNVPRLPGSERFRVYLVSPLRETVAALAKERQESQRFAAHEALLRQLGLDGAELNRMLYLLCPPNSNKGIGVPSIEIQMEVPLVVLPAFERAVAASPDWPFRHQVATELIARQVGFTAEVARKFAATGLPNIRKA